MIIKIKNLENKNFHVCDWPKDKGPCSGSFPKYYYNGSSCERFEYGGCEGNVNNFDTLEECHQTCASPPLHSPEKSLKSNEVVKEDKALLKTRKHENETGKVSCFQFSCHLLTLLFVEIFPARFKFFVTCFFASF